MSDDLVLVPMSAEAFAEVLPTVTENYAEGLVRSRHYDHAYARTSAQEATARVFPRGIDTPGMIFLEGEVAGEQVGFIWTALPEPPERPDTAYIYMVFVEEAYRRRGYGRGLIEALERELTSRGIGRLGLNVFGYNESALALYESLGFETASVQMTKALG